MKEIELNKQLPVITFNFEEVKASLEEGLKKYSNIVVTDENLKDCKATQKDLSKLSKELDTYRKDVKRELEKPIKEFEGQCKELIVLIKQVEEPIKKNIAVYDDKKREEKKKYAQTIINDLVCKLELIPKYADQLTVLPKYCNLTSSKKSIREDLEQRSETLKSQQVAEKTALEMAKTSILSAIETENQTCPVALQNEDYVKYIGKWELKTILSMIHKDANKFREAEQIAKEKAAKELEEKTKIEAASKSETSKEETKPKEEVNIPVDLGTTKPTVNTKKDSSQYYVVMEVKGPMDKIQALSKFLQANGYDYKALKKGKVE